MSLLKSESFKKGIIFSTSFNMFAKLIAFANSIIVAFYFGTQSKTDIYFYAIATIGLLIGFVTALDHSVLIPESTRIREQENLIKSQRFLNFFLYLYLCIGFLLTIVFSINPANTFSTISKFDQSSLVANMNLLYFVCPLFILMLVTTFLTDILASYKYFTMPMIASSINSILSIIFVVFFHKLLDIRSIVFGITLGYIINITILIYIMHDQLNWNFRFGRIQFEKKLLMNIGYSQFGNVFSTFASYVPIYLLSGFNAGIITALNYGRNVSEIPNQVITTQFSLVSGIKFNELVARKEFDELNNKFISTTNFLVFVLTPISGMLFLFSDEIIKLLFMRGAFNIKSVEDSALFLRYFGMLLPFTALNTMISRMFMASQKINFAFIYQIISNIIMALVIYLLIKHIGVIGYPIGFVFVYGMSIIFIYPLLKHAFPTLKYHKVVIHVCLTIISNILICYAIFKLKHALNVSFIYEIFIGGLIYIILLVLINELFSVNNNFKIKRIWNIKNII